MKNAQNPIENVNAAAAASVESTVTVKTVSIFPHSNEENSRLDCCFDIVESIPNIVRTDDGGFDVGEAAVLRMDRAAFIAQAINVSTLFRRYSQRFDSDVILGKMELGQLLVDAKLTIKRKYVEADGLTVMHNRFETELVSIKFDELSVMLSWPELPEALVKRLVK